MAQPVLQPLPVLDLNNYAGSHPLWWCIGHFVEVIMQDRRGAEWARLAMRSLELLEDHRESIRGEAGAANAPVHELSVAIVLPENQRPPLPGAREISADHELLLVPDWDPEPIRCPEPRAVNASFTTRQRCPFSVLV